MSWYECHRLFHCLVDILLEWYMHLPVIPNIFDVEQSLIYFNHLLCDNIDNYSGDIVDTNLATSVEEFLTLSFDENDNNQIITKLRNIINLPNIITQYCSLINFLYQIIIYLRDKKNNCYSLFRQSCNLYTSVLCYYGDLLEYKMHNGLLNLCIVFRQYLLKQAIASQLIESSNVLLAIINSNRALGRAHFGGSYDSSERLCNLLITVDNIRSYPIIIHYLYDLLDVCTLHFKCPSLNRQLEDIIELYKNPVVI
mgnify:CR=1 FL=1